MCELGWFVCLFCFLNARFAWDKDYTPTTCLLLPKDLYVQNKNITINATSKE